MKPQGALWLFCAQRCCAHGAAGRTVRRTVRKRSGASFSARHPPRGPAACLRTANAVRKALRKAQR
ncbi:MAG: hypothetical protein IJU56_08535 [Clostridia bacterium]|nr:hypothetical protein [Clostridia bacterium]